MRIQNKEYSDLIMNLAKATGQTPQNITEAQEMLKEGLTKVVSKNRNIPEDVLREMDEDKKELAQLRQMQTRQRALNGFQQVKDLHGLSREEVNEFADKLIENKLNPFEQDLDLVKEYRNLYFDTLLTKAREAGVQEERARALKAQQNSTTPSAQKGLPEDTGNQGKSIKSVMDLNALLDSLK
jgi:predicted ATPase